VHRRGRGLHRGPRNGLDLSAQQCLQVLCKADKVEQTASRLQLDHKVDVAVRSVIPARRGAEKLDGNRAVRFRQRADQLRFGQHLLFDNRGAHVYELR